MSASKWIWMCVEADEYELPLAVADTAKELGDLFGVSVSTIMTYAIRNHDGRQNGYRYIKVLNDG